MTSPLTSPYTYKEVTKEYCESLPNTAWRHCAHVMVYTDAQRHCFLFHPNNRPIKYTALMQMRFDGRFGFPGGFVEVEDGSIEAGLNREVREEMGVLPENFCITQNNYVSSCIIEEKKYCLHFYAVEVSFENFLIIEKRENIDLLKDFEVLGNVRVPLYILSDYRGGFPAFLRNNFIGYSRQQMLQVIRKKRLLSAEELSNALSCSQQMDNMSTTDVTK